VIVPVAVLPPTTSVSQAGHDPRLRRKSPLSGAWDTRN
jgi:hypothetical protein